MPLASPKIDTIFSEILHIQPSSLSSQALAKEIRDYLVTFSKLQESHGWISKIFGKASSYSEDSKDTLQRDSFISLYKAIDTLSSTLESQVKSLNIATNTAISKNIISNLASLLNEADFLVVASGLKKENKEKVAQAKRVSIFLQLDCLIRKAKSFLQTLKNEQPQAFEATGSAINARLDTFFDAWDCFIDQERTIYDPETLKSITSKEVKQYSENGLAILDKLSEPTSEKAYWKDLAHLKHELILAINALPPD